MTIGEVIVVGLVLFGFLIFSAFCVTYESKLQKENRKFRDSVKKSLDGIYKELSFGNYLNYVYCEEDKNED